MLFVQRDSDPSISDGKAQGRSVEAGRLRVHTNFYFAALREFDRVADQIHKDLTKPAGITDDISRHVWSYVKNTLQTLLLRLDRKCFDDFAQTLPQIEALMVQLQLAGLNLGIIQNVI